MNRLTLAFFTAILLSTVVSAQDTTWVQTFTFDSITTRRANFDFPQDLNDKRFEKVLMYYKLKCSPLTTWDQYNCGEWDYLTYTRVFDHTGEFDSVRVDGNRYMINHQQPESIRYTPWAYTYNDQYVRQESNRSNANLTSAPINSGSSVSAYPFDLSANGGRYQMLLTAGELIDAGVAPGEIQSLSLFIQSLTGNGNLKYPQIRIKSTTLASLSVFQTTGFTTVYNSSHGIGGSQSELVSGQNELLFYQPFVWNGTDNLIIEFSFSNSMGADNSLVFDAEEVPTGLALGYNNLNGCVVFSGNNHALMELSDFDLGNEMTIAFWAKGTGSIGTNTSVLEAFDINDNRVINIHMPWSDNSMYFDAGQGSGYDRINKAMTGAEIDNTWNHWAFVKNTPTGVMQIYKNGVLWHSGTNKNLPLGNIHRFVLGANKDYTNNWKGRIDEFQLYSVALDQSTIQGLVGEQPNNQHLNWSDLLVYYDFDGQEWAEDRTQNDYLLMPSQKGMFVFNEYPVSGIENVNTRPLIKLGQGIVDGDLVITEQLELKMKEPSVVFEFAPVDRHFEIVNAWVGVEEGSEDVYNSLGQVITSTPFVASEELTNEEITYYKEPYELIHDVEIARYITPYGIQFDLGPQGFTWIYDVTDYQQYLKNTVDLAAHNTQELLDLRFAFIEGIPPRDVHNRRPIWADFRSYQYSAMDNDQVMQAIDVTLSDTSEMFKIKTRMTGHGHNGSVNCCEWDSKDHTLRINGIDRFTWEIWEELACGENPNPRQGGTWPYAREGWCPGDMVREYDHELTPYVTPGETISIDYDIEDIPVNDQAQGNGNYVVAMDLISYSAPNFQHDAAIVDILNPNVYEYYRKWNPGCNNPRVIIQNTGAQPMTSCTVRCWVSYGVFIDHQWTGNLNFLEKTTVEIPVNDMNWWRDYNNTQTFTAHVHSINGNPQLDEYPNNNEKSVKYKAPKIIDGPFFVWFNTNNKAQENKWRLEDSQGNVIFERNVLANTTEYKDTFDLAPGCYSIVLEDSDHDGIAFWASNQFEGETSGQFRLRKVGGSYIEFFPGDFGAYHRFNFSVGFTLDVEELIQQTSVSVYPNPTNGVCTIELNGQTGGQADLLIMDLTGRVVHKEKMNATVDFAEAFPDLNHLPSGNYIVAIHTLNGVFTEKLIKQ